MLKLQRARVALAIDATGSALAASERLHKSQPSVTEALGKLEAQLGEPLFERSARGMITTDVGRVFFQRASEALAHLEEAEALLRRRSTEAKPGRSWSRFVNEGQLMALVAFVRTSGFTAAAKLLNSSQPAVHRTLREFETLAGLPLWQRTSTGVLPTQEAKLIARAGSLCLRTLERAGDDIRELRGIVDGVLRVGALPLARTKWVPDAIIATLALFPDAQVQILDGAYNDLLQALLHGDIDLIIGALRDDMDPQTVAQTRLFQDRLSVIVRANHPLACSDTAVAPAELAGLKWILPKAKTPARISFDSYFVRLGLTPPKPVIECSSMAAVRGLLLEGDFATPLSRSQVQYELTAGMLVELGKPLAGTERTIGVAERKVFRGTRLLHAFRACLDAALAGIEHDIEN